MAETIIRKITTDQTTEKKKRVKAPKRYFTVEQMEAKLRFTDKWRTKYTADQVMDAFYIYVRTGSIQVTAKEVGMSPVTLNEYYNNYDWAYLAEVERERQGEKSVERVKANRDHLRMYQALESMVASGIQNAEHTRCGSCGHVFTQCPNCHNNMPKHIRFTSASEIAKVAQVAIQGRRRILQLDGTKGIDQRIFQRLMDQFSAALGKVLSSALDEKLISTSVVAFIVERLNQEFTENPIAVKELMDTMKTPSREDSERRRKAVEEQLKLIESDPDEIADSNNLD